MSNKRLMVVDAHNQFLRSYIVDPSLSSDGAPIGGSKGFLKILNKLSRQIRPDMIVVVWDGEGGSKKRRTVNKNYKAGRKPIRLNRSSRHLTEEQEKDNRIWQQMRVVDYLNQTPVVQFMEPHVEADDVISYVVQMNEFSDYQKVIVSSDKDFIQLLDDKTLLFRPTQDEILNKNKVVEKFGIHPRNFALARAMAGDKSDNLPGVQGVGLATVAKRFEDFGEDRDFLVEDLFNACRAVMEEEDNKLKVFERIYESKELVESNYKIMQLYSPSISTQGRTRIRQTFENYEAELNKTGLRALMLQDGIGEVSLDSLFENFNRMVSPF